jgi:hypothetical protein
MCILDWDEKYVTHIQKSFLDYELLQDRVGYILNPWNYRLEEAFGSNRLRKLVPLRPPLCFFELENMLGEVR